MSETFAVFVNGVSSVFLGMAVLYVTIRVAAYAVHRWGPKGEKG